MRPALVLIDYAANDRWQNIDDVRQAWTSMISQATSVGSIPVVIGPAPDIRAQMASLEELAETLHDLALKNNLLYLDLPQAFHQRVKQDTPATALMVSGNHPSAAGHQLIAESLTTLFPPWVKPGLR